MDIEMQPIRPRTKSLLQATLRRLPSLYPVRKVSIFESELASFHVFALALAGSGPMLRPERIQCTNACPFKPHFVVDYRVYVNQLVKLFVVNEHAHPKNLTIKCLDYAMGAVPAFPKKYIVGQKPVLVRSILQSVNEIDQWQVLEDDHCLITVNILAHDYQKLPTVKEKLREPNRNEVVIARLSFENALVAAML
jgi:hypothetical protein